MEKADMPLVEDRGVHRGGAQDGHADALRGCLGAQGDREADDGVLGHHVAGDQAGRHEATHRGGVHDLATRGSGGGLLDHEGVRRGHPVHDAADVDVDDRVPLLE
jgi:hypothetical protein